MARAVRGAVGDDRQAAVVGHVEPLVGVGGPAVGALEPAREVAQRRATPPPTGRTRRRRAATRPTARTGTRSAPAGRTRRSSRCPPARRRSPGPRPSSRASASGSIAPWASAATRCAASRPSPIIRSALKIVACASSPAITVSGGAPIRPWPRRVPARALEHDVARDRQAGHVGHLRAGDEADARVRRQPEQREHPVLDDLLDDRRGGRADPHVRVLVPRRGQPVRRQRGGQRAAGDEAEVARPGATRRCPGRRPRPARRSHCSGATPSSASSWPSAARRASGSTGGPTGRSGSEAR